MTEENNAQELPIDHAQLSQLRVPLDQAGEVFAQKDARGRTPVVLVPENPSRIRNSFVIGGVLVLLAGLAAGTLLDQWAWFPLGIVVGLGLIGFGVYRSFLVRVPEGTTALLSRAGRFVRSLEAGSQIVPPWFAVSHLVTRREIPYDVPAVEALTKDQVRAMVDTLITFTITDPYRFVYSISADDFDEILLAVCLDAIRGQVQRLPAVEITGLTRAVTGELRQALNAEVEPYGVEIQKINVTDARPPRVFALVGRPAAVRVPAGGAGPEAGVGPAGPGQPRGPGATEGHRRSRARPRAVAGPGPASRDAPQARKTGSRDRGVEAFHVGGTPTKLPACGGF